MRSVFKFFLIFYFLLGSNYLGADTKNHLSQVSLNSENDYSRLKFFFDYPLENYTLRRLDVQVLEIDFSLSSSYSEAIDLQNDSLFKKLSLIESNNQLKATIEINSNNYSVRHSKSRDKHTVFVDLKMLAPQASIDDSYKSNAWQPLPQRKVAENILASLPALTNNSLADKILFHSATNNYIDGNFETSIAQMEYLIKNYPNNPYNEYATYLLAYIYKASAPINDVFFEVKSALETALSYFPNSPLAVQGEFTLAQINFKKGYLPEAQAQFILLSEKYPLKEEPFSQAALISAAEIALKLGNSSEARQILSPIMNRPLTTSLDLEAYAKIGLSYYQDGLYSNANEIFKQILQIDPEIYQQSIDIIEAMGEGYFHLNRFDTSRNYLYHALNLDPENKRADIIMARIGDTYRLNNDFQKAVDIYSFTGKLHPTSPGGLVSQMRLAEMGALNGFFSPERIFEALKYGSKEANVNMYKQIVENADDSDTPVKQLSLLKMGLALINDENYNQAIDKLGKLISEFPKGPLINEAREALDLATLKQAHIYKLENKANEIVKLYEKIDPLLENEKSAELKQISAKAYENIGDYKKAIAIWSELLTTETNLQLPALKALVNANLLAVNPLEALKNLRELTYKYPQEEQWAQLALDSIGVALANPKDAQSIENLLNFREQIKKESLKERALDDALEIALLKNDYPIALKLIEKHRLEYPDDPLDQQYVLTKAEIKKRQKEITDAWDILSDFRLEFPDYAENQEILLTQISEAEKLNLFDDAFRFIELYRKRYPSDPKSKDLLLGRYQKEVELERNDEALATLAQFRKDYPQDPRGADTFLEQYQAENKQGKAKEATLSLFAFKEKYPDDPRLPELILAQAQQELKGGNFENAYNLWSLFRNEYPNNPQNAALLMQQAIDERNRAKLSDSISHFQEFRKLYPQDQNVAKSYVEEIKSQKEQNNYPEQIKLYQELRSQFPEHDLTKESYLEQALLENQKQNYNQEIELYHTLREKFPDFAQIPQTYLNEIQLYVSQNYLPQAIQTLEEALEVVPEFKNNLSLQNQLSQLYLQTGQIDKWTALADKQLANEPLEGENELDRFFKSMQLAENYLQMNQKEEAKRILNSIVNNIPPEITADLIYNLATNFKELGDTAKYTALLQQLTNSTDTFWKDVAQHELKDFQQNQSDSTTAPVPVASP